MAVAGLAGWMRLGSEQATDPNARFPRVAAFNAQASRWSQRVFVLGLVVLVSGLLIWAAS